MHPILFQWGALKLSTYGLFVATGFIIAFSYVGRAAKSEGENPNLFLDLCFYILLSAIIGSRIFYIAINWGDYVRNPLAIFKLWQGGLVFYGGFIAAFSTSVWFVWKKRLPFWKAADIVFPAIPLGHAFGRIGCFFAGCCYGRVAPPGLPWAVTFHDPHSLAPKGIALHPSQLYSSLLALTLFSALFFIKRTKTYDGQVMVGYFLLYPVVRVIEELFRGDRERKFLPIPGAPELISTGQVVSFVIFLCGVGLYFYLRARRAKAT